MSGQGGYNNIHNSDGVIWETAKLILALKWPSLELVDVNPDGPPSVHHKYYGLPVRGRSREEEAHLLSNGWDRMDIKVRLRVLDPEKITQPKGGIFCRIILEKTRYFGNLWEAVEAVLLLNHGQEYLPLIPPFTQPTVKGGAA